MAFASPPFDPQRRMGCLLATVISGSLLAESSFLARQPNGPNSLGSFTDHAVIINLRSARTMKGKSRGPPPYSYRRPKPLDVLPGWQDPMPSAHCLADHDVETQCDQARAGVLRFWVSALLSIANPLHPPSFDAMCLRRMYELQPDRRSEPNWYLQGVLFGDWIFAGGSSTALTCSLATLLL